jgi:hypothetical protein
MKRKKEIRHIGNVLPICRTPHKESTNLGGLREDLPYKQYRDMPRYLYKNEHPFKMCKKCLSIIKKWRG